jgi:hypothetical protein
LVGIFSSASSCEKTVDGFATRRIRCLRKAIPAGFLLRPALPAVLVENSETCPADKAGKRMLPDKTLWVVRTEVEDV